MPPARAPERSRVPVAWIAGVVLLTVVVGVFVWLPQWVAETEQNAAPAAADVATVEPSAVPALSPEETQALKDRVESLLADLLTQQNRLDEQSAESWGGEQWQRYRALAGEGDDAYVANDFATAAAKYSEAITVGGNLLDKAVQTAGSALAAAEAAFAAGNSELAIRQYDVLLSIDPSNEQAQAGRARAVRQPEVLAIVQRADSERARGELKTALESYRAALAIDPQWEPARSAANDVSRSIANAEFERLMSLGFGALAAENFGDAAQRFRDALALRPNASEAADGLTQAEQGLKLDKIALTEARALAFERREMWDQAIAQYKTALADDSTLLFAQEGLERAQARAGLDAKLANLIENPTLLFSDTVLADARALLTDSAEIAERGPRLEEQMAKLGSLVELASKPIAVRIESDQLTDVTLYRVGALGVFATKQIELRPGTYTAIGSRDGYRDVRRTFTVLPGREVPPISVVCVEPI